MRVNELPRLAVADLALGGKALAKPAGRVVFIDRGLPGGGLLVWRVDLDQLQVSPVHPAVQLVQADGRADLDTPTNLNQGDDGDPFPGSTGTTRAISVPTSIRSAPGRVDSPPTSTRSAPSSRIATACATASSTVA